MTWLALETSSSVGSVALKKGNGTVVSRTFVGDQKHSTLLFPELEALGIANEKIDRIVVGLGPGSFSGVRVAIAAAQAIAIVQGCPVVGISSSWSVALQKKHVTRLGVFADARRGERYVTIFKNGQLERDTFLLPNNAIEEWVSKFTEVVSAEPLPFIETRAISRAEDYFYWDDTFQYWVRDETLEPIYLREPVVA